MQLMPSGTGISSDISRLVSAVSGLTMSYRRMLTISNGTESLENQETDPNILSAI